MQDWEAVVAWGAPAVVLLPLAVYLGCHLWRDNMAEGSGVRALVRALDGWAPLRGRWLAAALTAVFLLLPSAAFYVGVGWLLGSVGTLFFQMVETLSYGRARPGLAPFVWFLGGIWGLSQGWLLWVGITCLLSLRRQKPRVS